jgi:hypothetical protein
VSWTVAILMAAALAFSLKLAGHLVPLTWLSHPLLSRTADLITVGLLSSFVAVQCLTVGRAIALDARIPALAVAAVLLWRKAPFIVVVAAAAIVAAGLRLLGMP